MALFPASAPPSGFTGFGAGITTPYGVYEE